jgi:predicted ATP-grasp superfamily ATP-dependent carboligase
LARPDEFLVVALSGRALAAAARRSGHRVRVLDLFGDTDTCAAASASEVVAGDLERGFDERALLDAAQCLAPAKVAHAAQRFGLVYGAGLEDRPALLARLCTGRALYGNAAATLERGKDPRVFFPLLDELRIPHPELAFSRPSDPAGWLVKRAGASGGAHVAPADAPTHAPDDACRGGGRYWQRRIAGTTIGVSFLADGERAFVIGCNEQWTAQTSSHDSFRFGGTLQPADVHPRVASRIAATLDALVPALGLVGLNSLDAIVSGEGFAVIELNPRPGASLDVYDGDDPAGLFARHLRACEGELPTDWRAPMQATAMAIVYAEAAIRTPFASTSAWPAWVADRPAPGARIEEGAPVCTVLAAAGTRDEARRLVNERVALVRSALQPAARAAHREERACSRDAEGAAG